GPVSEISANTRGGQVGVDMRFSDNFIFGLAAGHADSNVSAVTRPESADVDLTQVGAYASWSAGEGSSIDGLYVDLSLMYAWGDVNTTRVQDIYGRTSVAAFDIQEFRFGGEVGFDFDINNDNFFITPLVGIQYRDVEHDEFVEEQIGGATTFSATERGGISLVVDEREDSNADFYIGADARYEYTDPDGVFKSLTPRASFRYTFADMDNASTQAFYAGGSSFTIQGVEVDNYFSFDAGVLAQVSERIGLFVNYKLTTGSDIDSHGIAAGVRIGLN
ncbi:MAG: autotransporter outer membrane beta-barrel domain-containing protein, partial [Sphingomonadales bacterium]|nr:autotransporter outer membrane beta-barrel domain-containing protein [Sphingomonadales bacterium]